MCLFWRCLQLLGHWLLEVSSYSVSWREWYLYLYERYDACVHWNENIIMMWWNPYGFSASYFQLKYICGCSIGWVWWEYLGGNSSILSIEIVFIYLFKTLNMRRQHTHPPPPPNLHVCKNHEAITFCLSLVSWHHCSPLAVKYMEGGCRVKWKVKGNMIHCIFCSLVIRKLSRWKSWVWIRNSSSLPVLSSLLPFHLWLTQCRIH